MAKKEGRVLLGKGGSDAGSAIAAELVQPGEGSDLVALGERRIVEDLLREVTNGAAERHHGLTDVHELGGALSDDVHAQERSRFHVEENLEPSRGVPDDLATCDLAVVRHADLVGDTGVGQLLL